MALLRLSAIVSVKLRYTRSKPGSSLLYFYRRIPDDVKPLLPAGSKYAGKIFYMVSLRTSDPRIAAPKVDRLVKETDAEWEGLRNPTRQGVVQQAHQLLVGGGIDPADPKANPLALDVFYDLLEEQLPAKVREEHHEASLYGYQVTPQEIDRHLPPVHAAAFQIIQGRANFTLADCLDQYIKARPKTEKDARMVFGYLLAFFKDKDSDIRKVRRTEVNGFVDWLLAGKHSDDGKPLRTPTVERYLRTLRAAFNRAIVENELGVPNVFSKVEIPGAGKDAQKRETFTADQYRHLYRALDLWTATHGPDALRCILALVAETGARLSEIVGLAAADVHLRAAVPYLNLREHPWRSLKTAGSSPRKVPLTPKAQETAQAALKLANGSPFLFPKYTSETECKGSAVSATLVQWVRNRDGLKGTKLGNHSLRHGMEDLLRAVECPSAAADQIIGHKTPGMGANYGEGYPLEMLAGWLGKATAGL